MRREGVLHPFKRRIEAGDGRELEACMTNGGSASAEDCGLTAAAAVFDAILE